MKKRLLKVLVFLLSIQAFPVMAEETDDISGESALADETLIQNESDILTETDETEEVMVSSSDESAETGSNAETVPEEKQEDGTEGAVPEELSSEEMPASEPGAGETAEPEETPETELIKESESAEEMSVSLTDPDQLRIKNEMAEHDVLSILAESTEGVDYQPLEVVLLTDSEEYALQTAEAYGGTLTRFDGYTAVIRLPEDGRTVYEAVAEGMSPESGLPAVDANWLVYFDEPEITDEAKGSELQSFSVPEKTDWEYWMETLENPDPLLKQVSYSALNKPCWQWYHEQLGTYLAWGVTTGNPDVKVAVIDSGVQENHEELDGKVTVRQVNDISALPSSGHGTHVAGIIAGALGNGRGGAGIAPDVSILSYNVFRGSSASAADIASGILKAAEDGAWIMNLSFGTVSYSQTVQDAVTQAYESGTSVFAAIGNYGSNLKCYPAAYDHVMSVAAVGRNSTLAAYSNYGEWCDLAAPGTEISSSYYSYSSVSSYQTLNGTSMASPVAAGCAALYMSVHGHILPDEMEQILKQNTVKTSGQTGAGIISLKKLFGTPESAPQISFNAESNTLTVNKLSEDERAVIVYTLDGKNPAVRNGKVVLGTEYTGEIDLSGMPYGTVMTVKAAVISGSGVLSDISSLKIQTGGPQPSVTAKKIDKITLINTSMTLGYSEDSPESAQVGVKTITLEDGTAVSLSEYSSEDYQWYSGNESIAKVSDDGTVTAAGKGTANIYLKIRFQNTVKTAKCRVTVRRLADSVNVSGRAGILPGKNLQMKASVLPKDVNNKNVTWSIAGISEPVYKNYASVSKDGMLNVKKGIPEGTVITVKAEAKDGSGANGTYDVTVCHKAAIVRILQGEQVIKTASLYTADLPETVTEENVLKLNSEVLTMTGEAETAPIWTSSKPKVAKVSADGTVTALARGTAVITCKASDGSGIKATMKVRVTVPTSGIFITVPNVNVNTVENFNSMVIGKSVSLSAIVGKVYGKPSVSTVKWSLDEAVINGMAVSDTVKESGLIKVSKTGKVSVSSKLLSKLGIESFNSGYITVSASAKDGTNHYDECRIFLQKSATSMKTTVVMADGKEKDTGNSVISVTQNKSITIHALFDERPQTVTLKSSNASRCGARVTSVYRTSDGYCAEIKITGGQKAGTADITVKENGGGKKAVIHIRTKEAE